MSKGLACPPPLFEFVLHSGGVCCQQSLFSQPLNLVRIYTAGVMLFSALLTGPGESKDPAQLGGQQNSRGVSTYFCILAAAQRGEQLACGWESHLVIWKGPHQLRRQTSWVRVSEANSLSMWFQASSLASLGLSFHICEMGTI